MEPIEDNCCANKLLTLDTLDYCKKCNGQLKKRYIPSKVLQSVSVNTLCLDCGTIYDSTPITHDTYRRILAQHPS